SAIYALSKHPDILCTEIIRRKTKTVFGQPESAEPEPEHEPTAADEDVDMMDVDEPASPPAPTPVSTHSQPEQRQKEGSVSALSQLLFIVGHVAGKALS